MSELRVLYPSLLCSKLKHFEEGAASGFYNWGPEGGGVKPDKCFSSAFAYDGVRRGGASRVRMFCAQNSQREGRTESATKGSESATKGSESATRGSESATKGLDFATRGSESCFSMNVCIGLGSSKETAGSISNPETRRTPPYIFHLNANK